MNKKCDYCGVRFDFNKSDIKEMIFAKKGEIFNSTEKDAVVGLFNSKVIFHTVTWELDEDIIFNGVKCECCNKINWMTNLTMDPSDIESDGWYIKKYGKMKCHEINSFPKSYKCTREEAKGHLLDNIASDALGEKHE